MALQEGRQGGFANSLEAALPGLGAKDPAPWRRRLCQMEVALPTSGGDFAEVAILELRLCSRDMSGSLRVETAGATWW